MPLKPTPIQVGFFSIISDPWWRGKTHVWEQSHSSIYLPLMQFCESKMIKRSCDFWHDWINSEVLFESIRLLSPWNKSSMFTLLPYVKRMHLKISWWVNLFFKKAVGGGNSYRKWHSVASTFFFPPPNFWSFFYFWRSAPGEGLAFTEPCFGKIWQAWLHPY